MTRIVKRVAWFLLLCVTTWAGTAHADDPLPVDLEWTMRVSGSIEIDTDGTVLTYRLDQPDALPDVVRNLAAKQIPTWRFEPWMQEGVPVRARSAMQIRYIARPVQDDSVAVGMANASFGPEEPIPGHQPVADGRLSPPRYPPEAAATGASGVVYLVLRIDRQGKVIDALAQQVNLYTRSAQRDVAHTRAAFAKTALAKARRWKFIPPSQGELAGRNDWSVGIPVVFTLHGQPVPESTYGKWQAYIPGPHQPIPWDTDGRMLTNDAAPTGELRTLDSGPKLLTPLH